MALLPETFLHSLQGTPGFNRAAFEQVHLSGAQVTSIRLNPLKPSARIKQDYEMEPVPWTAYGFYLSQRPSFTFDPLFHAGCYYVQDASSMAVEQALLQLTDLSQPLKLLDLSAAPGGKSTHLQSLISADSLLVSNEVIRNRAAVLTDNIIKWGGANAVVTNSDPSIFRKLPGFFDVLVADAPCSGSGLFRKDPAAVEEWSLNNVMLCSQRQQRILADALPCLKQGGLLIYSTCSYSVKEDEEIGDWLIRELGMEPCRLNMQPEWNIIETTSEAGAKGYRFYPDRLRGEGFYLSCFRKIKREPAVRLKPAKSDKLTAAETEAVRGWIKRETFNLIKDSRGMYAIPEAIMADVSVLQQAVPLYHKGVPLGEVMKGRLVPHHALAQNIAAGADVSRLDLDYKDAILYLQKGDLQLTAEHTGWQLACFEGHPLGWMNVLHNRINNYYPKELRILKQHNNTTFKK